MIFGFRNNHFALKVYESKSRLTFTRAAVLDCAGNMAVLAVPSLRAETTWTAAEVFAHCGNIDRQYSTAPALATSAT